MKRKYSHSQKHEPILEIIFQILRFLRIAPYIKRGSIVADLGCGYDGRFLKIISNKIRKGVGVDICVSTNKIHKNITLIESDINKRLPLEDSNFDIVTAMAVIEHIENPKKFILEINRILKKNGRLIITTPSTIAKPLLDFLAFKMHSLSNSEISDHKQYFDQNGIAKLLLVCGFKNIKVKTFEMGFNLLAITTK